MLFELRRPLHRRHRLLLVAAIKLWGIDALARDFGVSKLDVERASRGESLGEDRRILIACGLRELAKEVA
jgi:hypothetical protein